MLISKKKKKDLFVPVHSVKMDNSGGNVPFNKNVLENYEIKI